MASSRGLWVLLRKEIGELSRERVVLFGLLLGPLLLYIILGGMASAGAQGIAREAGRTLHVVLAVDGPVDNNVTRLASALNGNGVIVDRVISASSPPSPGQGEDAVVFISSGDLARLLSTGAPLNATIIFKVKVPNIVSAQLYQRVEERLEEALRSLLAEKAKPCLPRAGPESFESPANTSVLFVYRGRLVPANLFISSLMGATIIIPMALLIVVLAATQVSSVSLGIEKEARTLEKLLSMPVSFSDIINAKVLAIAILSLGGVMSNMIGLTIYLSMIGRAVNQAQIGESASVTISSPMLSVGDALMLLAGLAVTLYVTILIGLLIGSASEDLRGSQLSASYVGFALSLPLMMIFFGLNPQSLSPAARAVLSLDPYYLLALLTVSAIGGERASSLIALGGLVVHALAWSLAARVLLTPENILLGQPRLRRLVEALRRRRLMRPAYQ